MKKLLLLVVTLLSASFMSAQTMKEIPVHKRFHTIYGAQNETYNDGKDVKWWNALSAKELRV